MLESDRFIFEVSVEEYTKNIIKFLEERVAPHDIPHSLTVEMVKSKSRTKIKSVSVHILNKKFKSDDSGSYQINVKEKVVPESSRRVSTRKYSYELQNTDDATDFVRFDYKPYTNFPHLHINADEERWGNHLTYPDSTNIDLEKLDIIKALNIFEKYIHHPDCHILDCNKNNSYLEILA